MGSLHFYRTTSKREIVLKLSFNALSGLSSFLLSHIFKPGQKVRCKFQRPKRALFISTSATMMLRKCMCCFNALNGLFSFLPATTAVLSLPTIKGFNALNGLFSFLRTFTRNTIFHKRRCFNALNGLFSFLPWNETIESAEKIGFNALNGLFSFLR